jgi:hypothetical protein
MARLIAVAFATASIPRRSGSSIATTWESEGYGEYLDQVEEV